MSFPRFPLYFFFLLAAFLLTSSRSAAQALNYKIFTTRDGLAGDYITALKFDFATHTHWVGTTEGATHIEPTRWTSYTRAHGLGDSWITAIDLSSDGRVWFGTQSGGVSVLNPISRTITTYNLENSDLPSNFVTALAIDSQDRVWVGTLNNGVARFDTTTQKWDPSLPDTSITNFFLAFDQAQTPWAIADGQIYFWNDERWELRALPNNETAIRLGDDHRSMIAVTRERMYVWNGAAWEKYVPFNAGGESYVGILKADQITAAEEGIYEDVWYGTARGLFVVNPSSTFKPPQPLPVLLIHGWTVAGDDTLATSEFRFIKSYADRDGIPMYYARGVSPKNTLYQNAAVIRDEIARVKKETGAQKINIVAFSMGGMNTRAYLESSLYANDVHRAIILGTPQAGVEIWKPILAQQILEKPNEPSPIELAPEYAHLIVNQTRAPNSLVAYDLLIGDARAQTGLDFLQDMDASDALISVHSALALDAPNVRHHINADLHDWGPEPLPIDLTSYLYPRDTWERYLRNALRNNDDAPIGSEVLPSPSAMTGAGGGILPSPSAMTGAGGGILPSPSARRGAGGEVPPTTNHTPILSKQIRAGETITNPVLIDENTSARFIAYYPGGAIDFSLIAPDGKKYEPSDLPRDENGVLSLSTDIASFSGYVVKNASGGEWQMILTRADTRRDALSVSTYVELVSPRRLNAFARWDALAVGASNTITGFVTINSGAASREVRMTARIAQPAERNGDAFTLTELELFDDGKHNDGAANDGFFANHFTPTRAGWHVVFVQAHGETFSRAHEFLFAAAPTDTKIQVTRVASRDDNLARFNVTIDAARAGAYALSASLQDPATNTSVARVFIPTRLDAGANHVPLAFDLSRLARANFALEIILLDTHWAAVPLDRAVLFPN